MHSLITAQVVKCCIVAPTTMRLSKKDERLLERCLQLIHIGKKSSYETLSEKDGSVSILHKSIQTLATEMFKVIYDLRPEVIFS